MLYELRTTRVTPGTLPDFEKRVEAALAARQKHSRLGACWTTEIGPLLQLIELWPYEDQQHYAEVTEAVARDGAWPPLSAAVQASEVDLLYPAPFMRPIDGSSQKVGPVFELRIYQARSGQVQEVIDRWTPMIAGREALSPLLGCWYSDRGLFYHLWPYPDLATRVSVRAEAQRRGLWPPPSAPFLLTQNTQIMLPTSFSPIQ
jgi:hypothetical protein